ncbi:Murein DD-endopeptidase MepM [Myxococcaceae bacterium]|jgi:murein DD-endopeptidase MepM/ murein hydrolase activator NlpD|nr:Murein DD-endopeptidase MepM [Myxococcaceae bacterium]
MKTARGKSLTVPFPTTLAVGLFLVGAFGPNAFSPAPAPEPAPVSRPEPAPTDADLALRASAFEAAMAHPVASAATDSRAPRNALVTSGVIPPKGTLAQSLRAAGVSPAVVQQVAREMQSVLDFRAARAGDRYQLSSGPGGELREFEYATASGRTYRIASDGGRFVAETRGDDIVTRTARAAGLIRTTLWDAVHELGESKQLASDFAEIFQWDVDFAHGIRRGDEFQILYERRFRVRSDGREVLVGPGRILAARYKGAAGDLQALYFESEPGRGAYFRPDGSPMERPFLAAPLKYERVSSSFTYHRLHPILDVVRPHLGIDYVADEGTPLWSVADGKVIYRGWHGGFGNLVKVEHSNGYVSFYTHLSRFAKGLAVGDRVRQKEVIGYVGSTGLATGPHTCFRVQKDGEYVNPAKLRSGSLSNVSVARRGDFRTARETLLADLSARPMVPVDEAL